MGLIIIALPIVIGAICYFVDVRYAGLPTEDRRKHYVRTTSGIVLGILALLIFVAVMITALVPDIRDRMLDPFGPLTNNHIEIKTS